MNEEPEFVGYAQLGKLFAKAVEELVEIVNLTEDDEPANPPIKEISIKHVSGRYLSHWVVSALLEGDYHYKYAIYIDDINGNMVTDGY